MLGEVGLDIGLGGCSGGYLCQRQTVREALTVVARAPASSIHRSGMASPSRFERAGRRRGYPEEAVVTGQFVATNHCGEGFPGRVALRKPQS